MRISPGTSKTIVISALILASVASWLALVTGTIALGSPSLANEPRFPSASLAQPEKAREARLHEAYGKMPLSFEANQGQFDSRVKFVSRGGGHTLYLTSTEAVLRLSVHSEVARDQESVAVLAASRYEPAVTSPTRLTVLRIKLIGSTPARSVDGLDQLPGKSNYFIGNDPKKWRTGVTNYAKVRYRSVYKGIDLVYHGEQGKLEYDFNVAPGANPKAIKLTFDGAKHPRIDRDGDLIVNTHGCDIRQHRPIVYQELNGAREEIAARYSMRGDGQIGFSVARYDRTKPLVIDPVLSYSTYLGGSGTDTAGGIAVDTAGNAYITGLTESADFPMKNAEQPAPPNPGFVAEAFVTKLNSSGTALMYSTYLGGSDVDQAVAIAVDFAGSAYVTGYTVSTDFPVVNAVQPTHGAGFGSDGFVTKINPSGDALIYSTFLGGNGLDFGHAIAVDSSQRRLCDRRHQVI